MRESTKRERRKKIEDGKAIIMNYAKTPRTSAKRKCKRRESLGLTFT